MAAGKRTRSEGEADSKLSVKSSGAEERKTAAKGRKGKLAVNSNGAKKPKEKIGTSPLCLFQHDFLEDFLKKNPNDPKDQASIDAIFQTAADRWKSLSDADKAPYVARYRVLMKLCKKAIASMPTFRKASKLADILGKLKV